MESGGGRILTGGSVSCLVNLHNTNLLVVVPEEGVSPSTVRLVSSTLRRRARTGSPVGLPVGE